MIRTDASVYVGMMWGKKLIKYKRDYRAKRVPFKNRCKDQESGVFSQNRYMWFQKKKRNRKKTQILVTCDGCFYFDFAIKLEHG